MPDIKTGTQINGVRLSDLMHWNNFIPITPFSNQLAFLRSNRREILYGGAARGGKSVSMLAAGSQYVDCPGYNAVIIRKTYQELDKADGLIPLSKSWFYNKPGVHWNDKLKQWDFPSGATLSFAYLESPDDIYKFQGLSFQFIGFDEVVQHMESNYKFLFSRLVRTEEQKKQGIPLRVRCTANPGGTGHLWVYNRFINKKNRINIMKETKEMICQVEQIQEEDITDAMLKEFMPYFIPSKMFDNPYVDRKSYMANLYTLDPVSREQLLNGNWEIKAPGNMFNRDWFEFCRRTDVPGDLFKIRYWDLAATTNPEGDATATCHMGFSKSKNSFYIFDFHLYHLTPKEIEDRLRSFAEDEPETTVMMEREPGAAGKNNTDNFKRKIVPVGVRFKEDKVSGPKEERARHVSAAAEKGLVYIITKKRENQWVEPDWYQDVMAQLEAFPDGDHDDACISGGMRVVTDRGKLPIVNVKPGDKVFTRDGFKTVLDCGMTSPSADVVRITTRNGVLICTPNHRIWDNSAKDFVQARDLTKDSKLTVMDYGREFATEFQRVSKIEKIFHRPVYNMKVEDTHEFFAGNILTHNCDALSGAFNGLNHKTFHTGSYIGKMDWLMPPIGDEVEPNYGPEKENVFLELLHGRNRDRDKVSPLNNQNPRKVA
jgi:predicted phage terminase large subunit-like protein